MDDIVDLVSRSDEELKALIGELEAEEREVSRQRRMLQGKLDILRAELVMRLQREHKDGEAIISGSDVQRLSRILAGLGPLVGGEHDEAADADAGTGRSEEDTGA